MISAKSPALAAAAALIALAGCGDGGNQAAANDQGAGNAAANGASAAPGGTILAALRGSSELSTAAALVERSGLTPVLEGVGPYTLFTPTNDALDVLGEQRLNELQSEAMRPQTIALLRAHIVPGALTRRDIATALDNSEGGPVRMRTMADTMLTFAREGEAIVVSSADGARARLTGEEQVAGNGAVQPLDGVLRRIDAPAP